MQNINLIIKSIITIIIRIRIGAISIGVIRMIFFQHTSTFVLRDSQYVFIVSSEIQNAAVGGSFEKKKHFDESTSVDTMTRLYSTYLLLSH